MKIIKTASGKQTIKMSKSEWEGIGKKAGWMKEAQSMFTGYKDKYPEAHDVANRMINYMKLQIEDNIGKIKDIEKAIKDEDIQSIAEIAGKFYGSYSHEANSVNQEIARAKR